MSVINILSPHVADMIAAGEVVERPASVIKELMENSFDAGAHNVTVEIKGGGATYIRVSDDGCGMTPEDAGIAFLRHATSKIKDEHGLESIGTMGFRGEALAAISAVSKIELITRRRGAAEGTRVLLAAGEIQDMLPAGCPEGTVMTVRDIFYNTPARLKFLKSDRSEAAACELTALRCALGHPGVSVRFIRDGQEQFFSPGDGRQESALYALLGRETAAGMLPLSGRDEDMSVSGFVSSPAAGRGNRGQQFFFVNGRFIRSQLLQTALEGAYKNTLLTGRYPACVLYIEMNFGSVDVNVHPAKTEVKFSREKQVFDLVHYAARSALETEDRTAATVPAPAPVKAEAPRQDFFRSMSASELRTALHVGAETKPAGLKSPAAVYHPAEKPVEPPIITQTEKKPAPAEDKPLPPPPEAVQETLFPAAPTLPRYRIIGEALKTYIIVELEGELLLIDKHAAHERMIFDRLKAQDREITAQTLLVPEPMRLSAEDSRVLEENGELLGEMGFEIEPYGGNQYVVRSVPADMLSGDAAAAVEEICEKLRRGSLDAASARDEVLHTVACKAAIKAGWDTDMRELSRIVTEVLSGRVKYCPHGRPVSVTVTRKELDKMFKRIV